jgi:hypothetical protein
MLSIIEQLQRVSSLQADLSATVIVEPEREIEESRECGGEWVYDGHCFSSERWEAQYETVRIIVPAVHVPDPEKRQAAKNELEDIFTSISYQTVRYRVALALGEPPDDQQGFMRAWLGKLEQQGLSEPDQEDLKAFYDTSVPLDLRLKAGALLGLRKPLILADAWLRSSLQRDLIDLTSAWLAELEGKSLDDNDVKDLRLFYETAGRRIRHADSQTIKVTTMIRVRAAALLGFSEPEVLAEELEDGVRLEKEDYQKIWADGFLAQNLAVERAGRCLGHGSFRIQMHILWLKILARISPVRRTGALPKPQI